MTDIVETYGFDSINHKNNIEIDVWDLPLDQNLCDRILPTHKTTFNQIVWITKGYLKVHIDFQDIEVRENEILVIYAGQVIQLYKERDYVGQIIYFTDDFFSLSEYNSNFLYTSQIFNPVNANQTTHVNPKIMSNAISLLRGELENKLDDFHPKILHSCLQIILYAVERSLNSSFPPLLENIGRRFYIAVEENYRTHKKIDFYMDLLGVSEKQLSKSVKKLTGKAPKAFINFRIILQAKRLLAYSTLTVKEIGFNLGFDEPTNFNKFFHKYTNTTPFNFRELHLRQSKGK